MGYGAKRNIGEKEMFEESNKGKNVFVFEGKNIIRSKRDVKEHIKGWVVCVTEWERNIKVQEKCERKIITRQAGSKRKKSVRKKVTEMKTA